MADFATVIEAKMTANKSQVEFGRLPSTDDQINMNLLGQLYTADWRYALAAAGRCWRVSVPEHATGGGAITQATGNAAVDLNQPELVVSVPQGNLLIPIEMDFCIQDDADAYDDQVELYLFADRTQNYTAATATGLTPQNLLDGGPGFPGFATSIVTADIADPVHSSILAYQVWELTQVAAETAGNGIANFSYRKCWEVPEFHAGPCAIVMALAGTVAPTFMGYLTVAVVPSTWFPTS